MKKVLFLLILIVFGYPLTGQNYQLDVKNSEVRWTGKAAYSAYSLSGSIIPLSGNLQVQRETIKESEIVIDMTSILSDDHDQLTTHLKSKDFFEVDRFKISYFRLQESTLISANEFAGILKIKDQEKNETFPLKILKKENQIRVHGTLTINRTKYGIRFNSPSFFKKIKENAIADEFIITLNLLFNTMSP